MTTSLRITQRLNDTASVEAEYVLLLNGDSGDCKFSSSHAIPKLQGGHFVEEGRLPYAINASCTRESGGGY